MRYLLLGRSGLRVSELSLGTMTFGEDWGWGSTKEESEAVFRAYVDAGGNFFDTADGYTNGTSERILGDLVRGIRQKSVIATKFSFNTSPGDPNAGGNHRKHMVESVEGSLKRLGTDYIDLYWVHAWDRLTPIEETMRALDDLVRSGKILYIGVSDYPAWVVSRANTLAELKGWSSFAALQVEYSLIERTPERDLIPMAETLGLALTPWSPLGSGFLSGKYTRESVAAKANEGSRLNSVDTFVVPTEWHFRILDVVKEIAAETGASPAQVSLRWLLSRPNTIPIVGARKLHQFEDNLKALSLQLSQDQLQRLDAVGAIDLGFPHEFLRKPFVHNFLHGGTWDQLVPHQHDPKR